MSNVRLPRLVARTFQQLLSLLARKQAQAGGGAHLHGGARARRRGHSGKRCVQERSQACSASLRFAREERQARLELLEGVTQQLQTALGFAEGEGVHSRACAARIHYHRVSTRPLTRTSLRPAARLEQQGRRARHEEEHQGDEAHLAGKRSAQRDERRTRAAARTGTETSNAKPR